jgi:hypothetical protein
MRIATASLLLFCSGCFAITDLDRFQNPCDGDTTVGRPFRVSLRDMDMYGMAPTTVRVVDSSNPSALTISAVGVLDGINLDVDAGEVGFTMPLGIPAGDNFNAQIFVDLERNGFTFPDDPSWTREICDSGLFVFTRDDAFVDINDPPVTAPGEDFRFSLIGFDPHTAGTQKLELMVLERETGRAVGYYRLPRLANANHEVVIPGIIEPGRMYNVEFYVDLDQDDQYVAPPPAGMDHSWIRVYTHEDSASHSFEHMFDFDELTAF